MQSNMAVGWVKAFIFCFALMTFSDGFQPSASCLGEQAQLSTYVGHRLGLHRSLRGDPLLHIRIMCCSEHLDQPKNHWKNKIT